MIRVTFLLAEDRPPFRNLWEGDLPAVPLPDEPIAFNGRTYRVLERAWRFGTEQKAAKTIEPVIDEVVVMGCGVLVQQISGPPHVVVSPGSMARM